MMFPNSLSLAPGTGATSCSVMSTPQMASCSSCDEGWASSDCSIMCCSGHGQTDATTCSTEGGGLTGCLCEEGHGGLHCELDASHCSDQGVISVVGTDAAVADPPCACEEDRGGVHCEFSLVDCVVCGDDVASRCPCDCTANCENLCPDWVGTNKGATVWCADQGIKSLSSAPIVLPEGKVRVCVRVDPCFAYRIFFLTRPPPFSCGGSACL